MSVARRRSGLQLCLLVLALTEFVSGDQVQVWLTTGDQSKKLSQESTLYEQSSSTGYSVWVDRSKRRQTMEGFGAALTSSSAYVIYHSPRRHDIMQDLFGSNGLHMTYIRLPLGGSDFQAVNPYTYDDMPRGSTDFNMNHFSIHKDKDFIIPILKEALSINPNLKIVGTPWTAPGWMKTTDQLFGGEMKSNSQYLQAYALYFVRLVQAYQAEGITLTALTLQNEPLLTRGDMPSMTMPANTQMSLIRDHLGPMFRQNNIATKILVFDHNWSDSWYPEQVLGDANVRQYVSGVAWHGYSGPHDTPTSMHNKHPEIGQYFTEVSGGSWDTNWAGTLVWDTRIITIGQTRSWAKTVMFWNIALDENHGPLVGVPGGCKNCRALITVRSNDYTRNVEYYAVAHLSKFVQPGAVRLESASFGWDDLQTVAFQNPDGHMIIVVENPNSGKSASISLDVDAKHFHYYNLPRQSVATFVK